MKPSWDRTWFDTIDVLAKRSDDPKCKLGAIVVSPTNDILSTGWNGLPRGVKLTTARIGIAKGLYVIHAEQNALLNATCSLRGATLYCQKHPCANCAAIIIQKGIVRVIYSEPKSRDSKWWDSWEAATEMLNEVDIEILKYNA